MPRKFTNTSKSSSVRRTFLKSEPNYLKNCNFLLCCYFSTHSHERVHKAISSHIATGLAFVLFHVQRTRRVLLPLKHIRPRFPKPCPRVDCLPSLGSARRAWESAQQRARCGRYLGYERFYQSADRMRKFLLSVISIWIGILSFYFVIWLHGTKSSKISVDTIHNYHIITK